jgi:chaperonin GroES
MAKPTQAKKFAIAPLGDRVVVRPSEHGAEKKLPSGIIIPPSADKERPMSGMVVAVGPGKYEDGALVPMQLKKGDQVLFAKYGYEEVKIEGVEYYILAESAVLAVLGK